jgi:hypothetical protein
LRHDAGRLACLGNLDPVDMTVFCPTGKETFETRRRKKHRPDEIVAKLRDVDAMLNAGKDLVAVALALEVSDSTLVALCGTTGPRGAFGWPGVSSGCS